MDVVFGLGFLAIGGMLVYMGWKGVSLSHAVEMVLSGKPISNVAANVAGKGGAFTTTKSTGKSGGGGGGGAG